MPDNRAKPGAAERLQAKLRAGVEHHQRGEFRQAQMLYEQALALRPSSVEALQLLGMLAGQTGDHARAAKLLGRAVSVGPRNTQLLYNYGLALQQSRRFDEALASYDAALAMKPDYAQAHCNRGAMLQRLKRLDEALASYDRALVLQPNMAEALGNRGAALKELGRFEEAIADFERALAIDPSANKVLAHLLHAKTIICDWRDLQALLDRHAAALARPDNTTTPFALIALGDDPGLQLAAARTAMRAEHGAPRQRRRPRRRGHGDKIRVGYYSSDFREHATSYLMAEVLEAHNPQRFELYAFSFGPPADDGMRARIASAFHKFTDISAMTDSAVAELSAALGIDIAVDLKGLTVDARPGLFAEGCAPIQVNFLGYPGTMGADFIDYIIADRVVIPADHQQYFSEKAAYLPHSYQPNDSKRRIAERVPSKQECGLPESGFVFCSFNNSYKIVPEVFGGWMRLLVAAPGSVLWLLEDNAVARRNLQREAEARGVTADRLVFAPRVPLAEHLARHKLADLFLDTWPCNAHTTASDALWAGLPVLTRAGHTFTGRVAASVLHAVGLPELVTETQADYEALAGALAAAPEKMAALKAKLESQRRTSPLFDGALFAKHLEAAYEAMMARQQAGAAPDVIEIAPLD